ncbi:MAG: SEL1-like repeat protein [Devosia nanyangense]|uniref:SEL1-like repeat protein n=1 Tax=Devosia nanyangense TaxID=1228055 RepID=A0A933NYD2_9HYPH|nr:SEL1-like repeat protein [Devosia nanyangense]
MRGTICRPVALGLAAAMLFAAPALAVPKVVTLGGGDSGAADPVVACGSLAASPYEAGWEGKGVAEDDQVFLDGAQTACEAALAASPGSAEARAWLGRVYILIGRAADAASLLDEAASGGNPFAAYLLSGLVDNVVLDGVEDDSERAVALLKQASDGGFLPAETALARRYELGNGVDADVQEALRLYNAASDGGDAFATYKLGYFHQGGCGVDVDYGQAMTLFQRAADAGEPLGWDGIGQLYQFGQGVEVDFAKAAGAYQHGADQGEMMSETALAYLYEQGLGVTQDQSKSFALLSDAANQNYGMAQAALSIHYLFGEGTAVDAVKAFSLAWAAQTKSVTYAEGILGYMYAEGLGTDRDLSSALFHFQAGSDGGDEYSSSRIPVTETEIACEDAAGSQYEPGGVGHGLEFEAIDAEAAIAACQAALEANPGSVGDKVWLARAFLKADRVADAVPLLEEGVGAGNVLAQALYADLLVTGTGLGADPARALELYQSAADRNFAPAQFTLGDIYAAGTIVPADPAVALAWYRKALDFGLEAAAEQIALLEAGPDDGPGIDLSGFGREGPAY